MKLWLNNSNQDYYLFFSYLELVNQIIFMYVFV